MKKFDEKINITISSFTKIELYYYISDTAD